MGHFVDVAERFDELLVVSNDNEHEVLLGHSLLYYFSKSCTKTPDIFLVQIGCWFIQSQDAKSKINHKISAKFTKQIAFNFY